MPKKAAKSKVTGNKKVSDIIGGFLKDYPKPNITIGDLKDALANRAYGILIFILALPCIIPIPTPGVSAIVGAPLVLVSFQMMLGIKSPWFPKFIAKKSIKRDSMRKAYKKIEPYLKKLEHFMKPRLQYFVEPPAAWIISAVCFMLAVIMLLPVPFGNALPAFAICLFALAILMHDGLFVIFGIIMTVVSVAISSAFIGAVVTSLQKIFGS